MAEAGHYEALRKERTLQRKREWDRLSGHTQCDTATGVNTSIADRQLIQNCNQMSMVR